MSHKEAIHIHNEQRKAAKETLPSVEVIQQELGKASTMTFLNKDGIFARLFAETLETMLEAELTDQLGYGRYEAKGATVATVATGSAANSYEPRPATPRLRRHENATASFSPGC
ncbi:MAG: hypothetical protein R2844_10840 [Caldilineales bacterium]